ncbi:SULT6B1 [Bugula neritina]|uniref:SULT6B1 n=1 Tax=Bugula neritina TaxID=10212 RepID=A0A7J7J5Q8_BUGNE|nr:SULT6B1 [Bugula neritina]
MKPPSSLGLGIRRADNTSEDPLVHITSLQSPRILKTHLSWDILSSNIGAKAKIIHCIRNPKDVVCSYYSFLHKLKLLTPDTTWNRFFDYFINGNVLYGSYTSYMRKWYPYRNLANVLNIQFEDMKENLENNVREIAQFLDIKLTKEQIRRISNANTFDHKKQEAGKGHVLYRLGKSGGWRSQLTVEQNEVMDEWINTELKGMEDLEFKYGE